MEFNNHEFVLQPTPLNMHATLETTCDLHTPKYTSRFHPSQPEFPPPKSKLASIDEQIHTLRKTISEKDEEIKKLKMDIKTTQQKALEENAWLQQEAEMLRMEIGRAGLRNLEQLECLTKTLQQADIAIQAYKENEDATVKCMAEYSAMKRTIEELQMKIFNSNREFARTHTLGSVQRSMTPSNDGKAFDNRTQVDDGTIQWHIVTRNLRS